MAQRSQTPRRSFLQKAGVGAVALTGLAGCSGQGESNTTSQTTASGGSNSKTNITLATSVEGSTSFRIGSTFGQYVKRNNLAETFALEAVVSPGATGGYRMMDQGEVEASGPSTYGLAASPDSGPFKKNPLKNFDKVRQIRGFFSVQPFAIVTEDSGIKSWDDLAGKSISVGSAGAGTRVPSETIVKLALGDKSAEIKYIGYGDQPSALRGGRVDAIFGYINNAKTPSPVAPGWMQELDSTVNWRHIPYPDDVMSQFEKELPYASTFTINGGELFSSYTGTITAYNLTYAWCCHSDISPEVVYELTRLSHEHGEKLLEADSAMGFFPAPDRFLDTMHPEVPVHKGAYDYYTEAGLWEKYDLTAPPEA